MFRFCGGGVARVGGGGGTKRRRQQVAIGLGEAEKKKLVETLGGFGRQGRRRREEKVLGLGFFLGSGKTTCLITCSRERS